jgi:hypothetical protein
MFPRFHRLSVLALALLIPAAACDTGSDPAFGSVSILLTDAPGDVTEAWVTFTDIYLQGGGDEADPPGGRFYMLQDGDETHELIALQNNFAELVLDVVVPAGTYGQVRVVISGGCIVVEDTGVYATPGYDLCGEPTGSLQMPSFAQSGVKVLMHGFEVTGGDQTLLFDVDVEQTFGHQAGQSNMWVMDPVIHGAEIHLATTVLVTLSADEELELPEEMTLGAFSATLTPDVGDESTVDFEPANDVYRAVFRYLIAGNGPFEVALNAPEGFTAVVDPASPETVSPGPGQTAEIHWVLQSVEEIEEG